MQKEYLKLEKIEGPLIVLKGVDDVSYDEMADIKIEGEEHRRAKVVRIQNDRIIAQVFEGTSGISTNNVAVSFTGRPLEISLTKDILGRTFNGLGEPIDGSDPIISERKYNVNGRPMNPVARKYPRDYLETGISAIDTLTTLIRGQKLPIFSSNGLTHNQLAAQIVRQSKLKDSDEKFAIVFAGMGIKHDDYDFFMNAFEESGALSRVVSYINLADAPIVERISTPRTALTAAEYLAFEEGMHILVVMTDITSYAEALREISSAREEVPSRKGYPGYLYSDLSTLYERAGMVKGKNGSITLIPILTMPNDDITHPIPDLTGFITEGQIVLSRDLFQRNIYPAINILPSLSRLMKDGIGSGHTREDHDQVQSQLFALYSRVIEVRSLSQIIGEDDLTPIDKIYMQFGRDFEEHFLSQKFDEARTIESSLDKEMMQQIEKAKEIQSDVKELFEKAYDVLQEANITMGVRQVQDIALSIDKAEHFDITYKSIMGLDVPTVKYEKPVLRPHYSMYMTGEAIDEAIMIFQKIKNLTYRLAETENTVYKLSIEIKKNQKRANALEKMQIPNLEETVKYISESLEEKEREDFYRLKKIKKRKA